MTSSDELNKKISEAKGYVLYQSPTGWYCWYIPAPNAYPSHGWTTKAAADAKLPDWTGSEDASAVLLDEMRSHVWTSVCLTAPLVKVCLRTKQVRLGRRGSRWTMVYSEHSDRKTAIAMAWAKLKGIL